MKLVLSSLSVADAENIKAYFNQHSPNLTSSVIAEIDRTIDKILQFPEIGQRQNIAHVRRVVERRFGYVIYYRYQPSKEEIQVITIRHGRRRPLFQID